MTPVFRRRMEHDNFSPFNQRRSLRPTISVDSSHASDEIYSESIREIGSEEGPAGDEHFVRPNGRPLHRKRLQKAHSLPRFNPAEHGGPYLSVPSPVLTPKSFRYSSDSLKSRDSPGHTPSLPRLDVTNGITSPRLSRAPKLSSRSTSCPLIGPGGIPLNAGIGRSPRLAHKMTRYGSDSSNATASYTGLGTCNEDDDDRDINLQDEVIPDLPIEPSQNFPDIIENEELSEYNRRVVPMTLPTSNINNVINAQYEPGRVINIGQMTPNMAKKLLPDHDARGSVKSRCREWLENLPPDSLDDDQEGFEGRT